jgi:hypothetical protein
VGDQDNPFFDAALTWVRADEPSAVDLGGHQLELVRRGKVLLPDGLPTVRVAIDAVLTLHEEGMRESNFSEVGGLIVLDDGLVVRAARCGVGDVTLSGDDTFLWLLAPDEFTLSRQGRQRRLGRGVKYRRTRLEVPTSAATLVVELGGLIQSDLVAFYDAVADLQRDAGRDVAWRTDGDRERLA